MDDFFLILQIEVKEARNVMVEANNQEYAFNFLQQTLNNKIQDAEVRGPNLQSRKASSQVPHMQEQINTHEFNQWKRFSQTRRHPEEVLILSCVCEECVTCVFLVLLRKAWTSRHNTPRPCQISCGWRRDSWRSCRSTKTPKTRRALSSTAPSTGWRQRYT